MKKINWGKVWQIVSAVLVILLGADKAAEVSGITEQPAVYSAEEQAPAPLFPFIDTTLLGGETGADRPDLDDRAARFRYLVGYEVSGVYPVSEPAGRPGGYSINLNTFRSHIVESEKSAINGTEAKRLLGKYLGGGETVRQVFWIQKAQ